MPSSAVTITGNLTRDPELRFLPSGQGLATFTVAVTERWQDRTTKEWQEAVSFIDCKAFGTLAENVVESVFKGNAVMVSGRITQERWDTPEGDKRSRVVLKVEDCGPSLRFATAGVIKNERAERSPSTPAPAPAA